MKTEQATMPVCEIIEDLSIYPRHAVDDANVAALVRAMEAGCSLPPIVLDKKSKRIVDGIHRTRAYRRFIGPEAVIDVELRNYPDEAALVLDAVEMNSRHGRQFDAIDRTRAVVMLQNLGVSTVQIGIAMHIPEAQVQKLGIRVAKARYASVDTVPGTKTIALKRPVMHMAGKTLNQEQIEAHKILPGTSFLLTARQLLDALKAKMVNLEDVRLVEMLCQLRDELIESLP